MGKKTPWIELYRKPTGGALLRTWESEKLGQWRIHTNLKLVAIKNGQNISICDPTTADKHLRQREVWEQRLVSQNAKSR